MQNMEQYGRNGDTMMGHLTPGETVVPQQVLQQNPQVARGLGRAFQDVGADPTRYVVGSGQNSINPMTGEPEFFFPGFDKLISVGSKLLANPSVQGALTNAAIRKIQGKNVGIRDVLLGGLGGAGANLMFGKGTGLPFLDNAMGLDIGSGVDSGLSSNLSSSSNDLIDSTSKSSKLTDSLAKAVKNADEKIGSGYKDGLLGYGEMLGLDSTRGLGKFLDNKVGEGLFSGGLAQLMDSIFSKDAEPDDGDRASERFNRPSGQSPLTFMPREIRDRSQDGLLMKNEGGPIYFPRRNGGIMPSEGSGTKDDVPAMLTAGEFVMTRDAVKGAGGGNLNSGINKMYGMMDSLERKV